MHVQRPLVARNAGIHRAEVQMGASLASSFAGAAKSIDASSPSSAALYQTAPLGNITTRIPPKPDMKGTHVGLSQPSSF